MTVQEKKYSRVRERTISGRFISKQKHFDPIKDAKMQEEFLKKRG